MKLPRRAAKSADATAATAKRRRLRHRAAKTADAGAATAKHHKLRRVKSIVGCVIVALLLAVPALFVNNAIGYFPIIAYLLLLALLFVYLRLVKRGLAFEESTVGRSCQRGEKVNFSLTVSNNSFLPATALDVDFFISDLFGGERESVTRRVGLPPRSNKTFDFAVSFDHIGDYTVGIRTIEVSDPFGIFHYVKPDTDLHDVTVLPRLFDVDTIEVSTDAQQEAKRSITSVVSDGMDYCGVREYRWGDPIKAIHWKLSASSSKGDYFTRLYETNSSPGVTVFLDIDSLDYDEEGLMSVYDSLVESALSIERWASKAGYETDVVFLDDAGQTVCLDGPLSEGGTSLLEKLPRVRRGDGRAMMQCLRAQAASIYAKNNFIVCSACLTDELVGEIIRVKTGRLKPILVGVVPPHLDREPLRAINSRLGRLSAVQVDYAVMSSAAELAERG